VYETLRGPHSAPKAGIDDNLCVMGSVVFGSTSSAGVPAVQRINRGVVIGPKQEKLPLASYNVQPRAAA
jgi:hypothetical protein